MAPEPAAASANPDTNVRCSCCLGLSVYTKAMWKQRQKPKCKGILMDFPTSRERMREIRERSATPPRKNEFTFMSIGLSFYSSQWMEDGTKLPYVKGLGVIAVHDNDNELMKQIEERKRIKRELQKNRGSQGDLQDGSKNGDDDDDLVEEDTDDGLFENGEVTDEGHALVGSEVVRGLKTPRGPAVVPASISMAEIRSRAVEKVKYSVHAVYKFWERRLDGFGYRYVDSCRRLTEQMEKQARNTPQSVVWLVHRIEEYIGGKDGGKK
ncbi:hypothetical protein PsorP6_015378 [Peronosclerospora sorghi]|uniref:Uncharacterized protein n=1 Tax=Peronosclerospora sorghi TaxID=230839 RepID=A0ACC0WPS5_9STRA|nr:hypothetical protein PsorP6_015378 [Peronosclerospora sorghi]